jgi:hypothetical protein
MWFLIDFLKHRMNECVDNIPYELRILVRQACGRAMKNIVSKKDAN